MIEEYYNRKVYTIFLNSKNKTSGTNNNANYTVTFPSFFPQDLKQYKLRFLFSTIDGVYRDGTYNSTFVGFSTIKILCDLVRSNTVFDTATNGSNIALGMALRNTIIELSNGDYISNISSTKLTNPSITINNPITSNINVQLINLSTNSLLLDTNQGGTQLLTDSSNYVLTLELEEI